MWKAILVHKIKERVWRCAGVTILPGRYDSDLAALRAAKKAKGAPDPFFKDVPSTCDEESPIPMFYE